MRALRAFLMAVWGLLAFLVVEICVFLPLYLVGIPVAWWASSYAATTCVPSHVFPDRLVLAYRNPLLNWWVGNYEDGVRPVFDWWPASKSALQWFLRNPVTNLRFTPGLSTLPDPPRVHWVGTANQVPADGVPGWFLAWQGPYVGFRWQTAHWGVWLGWKINPRDAFYLPADDYRRWGIGLACQLLRF